MLLVVMLRFGFLRVSGPISYWELLLPAPFCEGGLVQMTKPAFPLKVLCMTQDLLGRRRLSLSAIWWWAWHVFLKGPVPPIPTPSCTSDLIRFLLI